MSDIQREANGYFQKGTSGNPAGRPTKARELAYLAVLKEVLTLEDWRKIVQLAVKDATRGKAKVRAEARRFLAEYAIGKPPQTIRLQDDADPFEKFNDLTDEELRAIVASGGEAGPGVEKAKRR